MSDVLIEARGIGKKYRRTALGGIRVPEIFGRLRKSDVPDEFWALKDIDLELKQGDSLGIIGPNGAGKSTLLKILSRVTKPTEGVLKVRGRVGALIEVGAGFHPELSGRDNIFINGAILGMSRREIKRRFDEIVAFAELEDFIDTPVKKYSSGMYVRLGFAVAAHMDPDVLLVDEVLAVGDMAFQQKCRQHMVRVVSTGVPVVFVSHNLVAVREMCPTALCLNAGTVVYHGATDRAVQNYMHALHSRRRGKRSGYDGSDGLAERRMYEGLVMDGIHVKSYGGRQFLVFEATATACVQRPVYGYILYNSRGQPVCSTNTAEAGILTESLVTGDRVRVEYPLPIGLVSGVYLISCGIATHALDGHYDWREFAATIDVVDNMNAQGYVSPAASPSIIVDRRG